MRRTGGTPKDQPQDVAEPGEVDAILSEETIRRLGEAAGVSGWTWHVKDNLVYHMGGSRRRGRLASPLDDVLQSVDAGDRNRVKRRLRAAVRSGNSGTMQLRSAASSGSR